MSKTGKAYISWVVLFVSAILFLHAMYIYNAPVAKDVELDQEQKRLEEKKPEGQQLEKKQEQQSEQQNGQLFQLQQVQLQQLQIQIQQLQQQLQHQQLPPPPQQQQQQTTVAQQQSPQQQQQQQQVLTNTSFEAKKQIFYKFFRAGIRGCVGVEEIMCILKDSYEEGAILIDIGSNVGMTSATFMSVMNELEVNSYKSKTVCYKGPRTPIPVIAIEASPFTFETLVARSKERNWDQFGFQAYNYAVSDNDTEGKFFFDPLKKDSEHSSLNEDASKFNVKEAQSVTVTIRKLDTFLSEKGINSPIFVLKIDTEGFDPIALKGAQNVLSNKRARFVSFEYGDKWKKVHKHTLKETITWLYDMGYLSFMISDVLIPIYGQWWHGEYENFKWKNIFCVLREDPNILSIVSYFNIKYDAIPDDLLLDFQQKKEHKVNPSP